jgi:DNA-binding MarR family transcriptional regulator
VPADRSLSPRVLQILPAIDSFEKLQAMCLTAGRRDQAWWLLQLAGELRLDADDTETLVEELVVAGLVERSAGDQVRYAPQDADTDAAIAELIAAYRDDTLLVVRAITERAMHKIRDSVASTFADAFVVRRPKPREPSDG